jgi:hypothetical protein
MAQRVLDKQMGIRLLDLVQRKWDTMPIAVMAKSKSEAFQTV